jgi:hypothetical protein
MLLAPLPEGQQAQGPSSRWQLKVVDYGCSTFCMPGQKLHEAVGTVSSTAHHSMTQGLGLAMVSFPGMPLIRFGQGKVAQVWLDQRPAARPALYSKSA